MAYRYDKDLEFLGKCSDEELEDLFYVLSKDPKDGGSRWTETLTKSDEYKKYKENYSIYWKRIAEELQLFGGNSISNLMRAVTSGNMDTEGVLYREIVEDVAAHFKVYVNKYDTTEEVENNILEKLLEDILKSLSEEEKEKLLKDLEIEKILDGKDITSDIKGIGIAFILKEIFKRGGFASYKMTLIIVNMVWKSIFKKGLSLAANRTLTKTIGMVLPGINILLNAWLIVDLTSPAMRVTIPAVLLIATLRKKYRLS